MDTQNRLWTRGEYVISTEPSRLDVDMIHGYLARESYWALNIPRETVEKSIRHSLCYGIYREKEQVGFGRLITDYCTFGYLCDIFVTPPHRSRGLSKWLVECMINDPEFSGFRNWTLYTKDAQSLYAQFGFKNPDNPLTVMRIKKLDPYGAAAAGMEGMFLGT
jgi:N-acetylglutamate synthase-like GNAT family acetyltransferase